MIGRNVRLIDIKKSWKASWPFVLCYMFLERPLLLFSSSGCRFRWYLFVLWSKENAKFGTGENKWWVFFLLFRKYPNRIWLFHLTSNELWWFMTKLCCRIWQRPDQSASFGNRQPFTSLHEVWLTQACLITFLALYSSFWDFFLLKELLIKCFSKYFW